MNCQKFRTEFEELERGAALSAPAESHAARCRPCRGFRAEGDAVRALVGGLARVEAPGDFEFRLRARIARADGAPVRRWSGFVPGAAWLSAAACLVLALGLFIHFRPGRTASPQATPSDRQMAVADGAAATNDRQPIVITPSDESQVVPVGEKTVAAPSRVGRRASAPRRQRFVLPQDAVRELAGGQPVEGETATNVLDSQGMKIYVGSPIALPVSTQERPLEALFKDTRGATRAVSVNAVTFGARDLPSRRAQIRTASYAQGVW